MTVGRLRRLTPLLSLLPLLVAPALLGACSSHPYRVEEREVPVHVWLSAPELARAGGTVEALVYVGSTKVVEGPVRVEAGRPTVALPTAFVRAGPVTVSAVLGGGAAAAEERVEVEGETWVQVRLVGRGASLRVTEEQPSPDGR